MTDSVAEASGAELAECLRKLVARGCAVEGPTGWPSTCFFCRADVGLRERHFATCPYIAAKVLLDEVDAANRAQLEGMRADDDARRAALLPDHPGVSS